MADNGGFLSVDTEQVPTGVDTSVPSIARVYDAGLGGKNNFAVDREVMANLDEAFPEGRQAAARNREFLVRVVRHMVSQGIDQFLDLGSGLPTVENTHQVAQRENPDARVVYVDNDPIVLAHGRALLAENERTTVVTADVREPDAILAHPEVREYLDLSRPLGLLLLGVVHHVLDEENPDGILARYKEALPPGTLLALSHSCDSAREALEAAAIAQDALGSEMLRGRQRIAEFFSGLDVLEPGVVHLPQWRPEGPVSEPLSNADLLMVGGVGRLQERG